MVLTGLIDGDILVYQAATAVEVETQWSDYMWTLHSDLREAQGRAVSMVNGIIKQLGLTDVILALSDTGFNFRKSILPTYKIKREGKRKPLVYHPLRAFMKSEYTTFERPGLEGDDVLGILSTSQKIIKGDRVIVSIDKDMKTIPGKLFNTRNPDDGMVEILETQADYNHLYQTLVGDDTDGYAGCRGIGAIKAARLLDTHGATWDTVKMAYLSAGLTEEMAITQARVARILRASDYDFTKKVPILWNPSN